LDVSYDQYDSESAVFLPIQLPQTNQENHSSQPFKNLRRRKSEELIGLGLYDPPEPPGSWLLSGTPPSGKGLKLEETWQPPPTEDENEEVDDESSEEEEEEEPPQVYDHQEWSATRPAVMPMPNMNGHSFFFEDDEAAVSNEWWYHQIKYPNTQLAGIVYGWLQS